MIRVFTALLLLATFGAHAGVSINPNAAGYGAVRLAPVAIMQVSSSEFTVRLPVTNAHPDVVQERRFSKHATTNVWWMSNLTVKDLRGGVSDIVLTEPDSVPEYAMQLGYLADSYEAGVTFDFYGSGHGYESRTALTVTLDGESIGLSSGAGLTLVVDQAMNILKPVGTDAGTTVGSGTLKHTIDKTGVLVDHTHTITSAGMAYRTAYGTMMPGSNTVFNRSKAGTDIAVAITGGGTTTDTGQTDADFQMLHTDPTVNPYRIRVTLPYGQPELNTAWSAVSTPKGFLLDLKTYPKWYLPWRGGATSTAITQGSTSTHKQFYDVILGPP